MRSSSFFLSLGLLAVFVTASGCGTNSTDPSSAAQPRNPSRTGSMVPDDAKIPANFPSDTPQYPGATVRVAMTNDSQSYASLNEDTNDDLPTVKAWMSNYFQNTGFTPTVITDASDLYLATYNKGNVHIQLRFVYDANKHITNLLIARSSS